MPSSITILIERSEDGNLTEDALLYQDILKHASIVTEFDLHKLTAWLLNNNKDFINDFKSLDKRNYTKANRISNKRKHVHYKIDDLVHFQIVRKYRTGVNRKKVNVQYYRITNFGQLLLFLIEYHSHRDDDIQRKNLAEYIYKLLINAEEYKDSLSLFDFNFFKTLKEWNSFDYFVDRLARILFTSDIIYNHRDLMAKAEDSTIMDDLWEIRKEARSESFKKLDPLMKKYYLFNLKSLFEAEERKTVRNFDNYEKLAFLHRNDYEVFVKEIECPVCDSFYCMVVRLREILERTDKIENYKCPNCNNQL